MFNAELSMHDFTRFFSVRNPAVLANKETRFTRFLADAKDKTMFNRPNYISTWTAHFTTHPPIMDRLQSSYKDCKYEFNVILEWARAQGHRVIFIAGDGLTVGRGNHIFSNNIDEYLDEDNPPWIIWVHGEMPHMAWHVLHAT